MHFLVNFIISENKYQGHTSYIRTVYTETLLLKNLVVAIVACNHHLTLKNSGL